MRTEGMICQHCGAVWDQAHESGSCGVAEATRRILSPPKRLPPEGAVGFNGNYAWRTCDDGDAEAIVIIANDDGTLTWRPR